MSLKLSKREAGISLLCDSEEAFKKGIIKVFIGGLRRSDMIFIGYIVDKKNAYKIKGEKKEFTLEEAIAFLVARSHRKAIRQEKKILDMLNKINCKEIDYTT